MTWKKQKVLDPPQFQLWFQRYYLGMTDHSDAPANISLRHEEKKKDRQSNTSIKAAFR